MDDVEAFTGEGDRGGSLEGREGMFVWAEGLSEEMVLGSREVAPCFGRLGYINASRSAARSIEGIRKIPA